MEAEPKSGHAAEFSELADIVVNVACHHPGDVIEYLPVTFHVLQNGDKFKAVPLCTNNEFLLTRLPSFLLFRRVNNRFYAPKSGYNNLLEDVVMKLVEAKKLQLPADAAVPVVLVQANAD